MIDTINCTYIVYNLINSNICVSLWNNLWTNLSLPHYKTHHRDLINIRKFLYNYNEFETLSKILNYIYIFTLKKAKQGPKSKNWATIKKDTEKVIKIDQRTPSPEGSPFYISNPSWKRQSCSVLYEWF